MVFASELPSFYSWMNILVILEFIRILWMIALYKNLLRENNRGTFIIKYINLAIDSIWLIWQINGNIKYYKEWSLNGNTILHIEYTIAFPLLSYGYVYVIKYLVDVITLCFIYPINRCYIPPSESVEIIEVILILIVVGGS